MTSGLPGLRSANAPDAKAIDTSESRNIIPECSPRDASGPTNTLILQMAQQSAAILTLTVSPIGSSFTNKIQTERQHLDTGKPPSRKMAALKPPRLSSTFSTCCPLHISRRGHPLTL